MKQLDQPLTDIIPDNAPDFHQLAKDIKAWGLELGFQQIGITDVDLSRHEAPLQRWLERGFHGEMNYMAN